MNWIILVFISAFANSSSRILQKVLLKNKDSDPFAFSFVYQMGVAFVFLIYALISKTLTMPNLSGLGINLIIMTIFYSLGNLFIFKAFKLAQASEVSIIFASNTVWSILTALLFLGEKLSLIKILGIILVLLGIIAVNYSKTNWKFNKGHLFALLGALFFGIAFINDIFIINHIENFSTYMIISFAFPAISTLFYSPKSIKNIPSFINKKIIFKLLICSSFFALSFFSILSAYRMGGPASVISPIQQSNIIITVILSYFFLKERDRLSNKIIGTILTFIGILFLV